MAITMSQLASRYAKASRDIDPVASKQLSRLAQVGVGKVKRAIQDYHAVDHSIMLNSTSANKINSSTYLIGPTTHYAPFVALGTSRMKARPFHIKGARDLRKELGKNFNLRKGVDL